jgi:hypothetical protein
MADYGVRARLAWYWRRIKRMPHVLTYLVPPLGFYSAVVDPRPPWRNPEPVDWSGWRDLGYTTDEPPEAFRRKP